MPDRLVPLGIIHHGATLAAVCQLIAANTHNQVDVWEYVLCLERHKHANSDIID